MVHTAHTRGLCPHPLLYMEARMSKQVTSALSGLVVAVLSVAVARGWLGGTTADQVQTIAVAAISFLATVGLRSARP